MSLTLVYIVISSAISALYDSISIIWISIIKLVSATSLNSFEKGIIGKGLFVENRLGHRQEERGEHSGSIEVIRFRNVSVAYKSRGERAV